MNSLDLLYLGNEYIIEYLFVYGDLEPNYYPPEGAKVISKDSVRGDLYDLENDAALVNIGASPNIAYGYTLLLTREVLLKLDKSELLQYSRVKTTTSMGYKVWVYKYIGSKDLTKYPLITKWKEHK